MKNYVGQTLDQATIEHEGIFNDHIMIQPTEISHVLEKRAMEAQGYNGFLRGNFNADEPPPGYYISSDDPSTNRGWKSGKCMFEDLLLAEALETARQIAEREKVVLLLQKSLYGVEIIWQPEDWEPKHG